METIIKELQDQTKWRAVDGYDGEYYVSPDGRVYSTKRNILLKSNKSKTGYLRLSLCKKGNKPKCWLVHRIVAIAFIPNNKNKPEVNHLNGIKSDNRVTNLQWATKAENLLHAEQNDLTANPSIKIIRIHRETGDTAIFTSIHQATAALYPEIDPRAEYRKFNSKKYKIMLVKNGVWSHHRNYVFYEYDYYQENKTKISGSLEKYRVKQLKLNF